MTVELKPRGVACNLGCAYCYQHPLREAGNVTKRRDFTRMLEAAKATGQQFSVFGGEPLLASKEELEEIFRTGFELHGKSGIQTAGNLVDDDHVRMFSRYKVGVGVSIDGPDELNSLRVAGNGRSGATEEATRKSLAAIEKMVGAGISVSVIVTLHRENGSPQRLPRLIEFLEWLESHGVRHVNVHLMETESEEIARRHALSDEEEIAALLRIAEWCERHPRMTVQPFADIRRNLEGKNDQALCIWRNCDPLTTPAVHGIEADGSISNCGRISKEGIGWLKSDSSGYERYISLYHSDQDKGGCRGCRFFLTCGGSCPGEGEKRDWRNKTDRCPSIMALSEYYERKILESGRIPLSLDPERLRMEAALIETLSRGMRPSLSTLRQGGASEGCDHGDAPHGDSPHGDSHGDHYDS